MATCSLNCATDLPDIHVNECGGIKVKKGGILRIIAAKCSFDVDTLIDLATFQAAINSGDIVATPEGMGSKPIGSNNQHQLKACGTSKTTSVDETVTFNCYDTDEATGYEFSEYDAFNTLAENADAYQFALLDCSDNVRGWIGGSNTDVFVGEDIPETDSENVSLQVQLTYRRTSILKPLTVTGLNNAFKTVPTP